jgi:ACDE family multidrug resistance protein
LTGQTEAEAAKDRILLTMNAYQTPSKLHLDPNLHIVFAVTLMAIMGVANITPAFPRIARELHATPAQVAYLITYFTVPGVFLAPVLGVLADRTGRKRILAPSLFLFGVAGAACGFVSDFHLLLGLRFLQGVGAAALGSLNVTILGDLYSGRERTTAMGYNSSVLSVGTAIYPLLGGALATIGWHYPFLVSIIAVPVGFVVLLGLKSPEPRNKQPLRSYFGDVWQIVRKRSIIGLFAGGLVTFIVLYGSYLTFLPFLIAHSFHGTPLMIGLIMSCASISTALTASQLGWFVRRWPEKRLLATGFVLFAVSMTLVPRVPSLWLLLVPAIIQGVAMAFTMPTINSLMAAFAPPNHRGAIMSLNGMVLRLGQTLGPIVMSAVFASRGFFGVYLAGSLFALGMSVVAIIMIEQPKEQGGRPPSP